MASRAARSSASKRRHAACALARTCSALVAPAMTEVTGDCCASQGERRLHLGDAAFGAEAVELRAGPSWRRRARSSWSGTGANRREYCRGGTFAGQQAVSEREVRRDTHAEVPCGGQDFEFCAAVEQVVVVFSDYEPFGAEFTGAVFGVGEPPAGEVGVAQVADFAVAYMSWSRALRVSSMGVLGSGLW